jgi:hypothetical protein
MASAIVPPGYDGRWYAPALVEVVALLKLMAGDPTTIDRAMEYSQGTVTDTAVTAIARVQSQSENFSILLIQFSETSGTGRFLVTGANPTAAGFGMPILSGGTTLTIRGVDNINQFRMIAETGQTMEFNALLFKAQAWQGQRV